MRNIITKALIVCLLLSACKAGKEEDASDKKEGRVPVTITQISAEPLVEGVELNASSQFLLKTFVKANVNGYLQEVNVKLGDKVEKGTTMFVIRSKEAAILNNAMPDSSFKFNGLLSIKAPSSGYITQMTYQVGNYVQDGETLAAISDVSSLAFMLELPYELKPYLPQNNTVELTLPDGQKLSGIITSSMPLVDQVSQTQSYIIKVSQNNPLPENLVAKVFFTKKRIDKAISLPKEAIVTNETQTSFWIMKLIDSITAVKVIIKKGIETGNRVEVLEPAFSASDKILLTGNFGLPDTAKVIIITTEQK